jgi:simple sugar transport system substrate-binding protein/ribose transport system substrate-binding protein
VRTGMQALLLQNQGKVNGIWASFDGQAYIIDDLLKAQGVKKVEIALVSMDGGPESYARIADPESTFVATVSIPFEQMGKQAVDAIDAIVVKKQPKETITSGPYLFTDAVMVDKTNVKQFLK